MSTRRRKPAPIRFDARLMRRDMTLRGWTMKRFAKIAGVADTTVIRFLSGEFQTGTTALKLAIALGHPNAERYMLSRDREAVA